MHVKETLAALAVVAVVASLGLVACSGEEQSTRNNDPAQGANSDGKPSVVATYSILGDYVANVGGENIDLTTLVGPDGDAHTFEPTPQDGAKLSKADLIFENGLEFETWLDDLHESSGAGAERVVVTERIDPLTFSEEEPAGEADGSSGEGELDPHVWQDVSNAGVMVESVRDALIEIDPENTDSYRRNAEEYLAELEALDTRISAESANIPEERRKLVTSHDTFGYFSEAYGYEIVGTGLPSFTTEAADPAAGETAELVEEIRASGVPAIFTENISNPALMEQIARESDVELAPTLYTDALGEGGSEGDTYIGMMNYNIDVIAGSLGG